MEVLAREPRPRRGATRAALVVTVLLGAGCLVMEQFGAGSEEFAFSHRVHVEGEELECFLCHLTWEESDEPGMPSLAACQLCHDPEDEDAPPVAELFDGEELKGSVTPALSDEIVFSHLAHATDEDSCVACHAEVIESDAVKPWMALDMDGCMACHAQNEAPNDCSTCHSQIDVDSAPWTHDGLWGQHHGLSVRNRSMATVDRCDLCHKDSACIECHIENPPQNHNNFFRRRGHGLEASMDRQTCAACHTQDFCNRCHESAIPVSHRGPWGSPRNTHCLSCHLSGGEQSCDLCHQGYRSHDTSPPLPPGHDPASDCRECHQLLSHVDNGDNCLICHQ